MEESPSPRIQQEFPPGYRAGGLQCANEIKLRDKLAFYGKERTELKEDLPQEKIGVPCKAFRT